MTALDTPSTDRTLVHLLAAWMSERFYRTFRPIGINDGTGGYDALLKQRERTVGVFVETLWPVDARPELSEFETLLTQDIAADNLVEPGGYGIWIPPKAEIPTDEPDYSELRLRLAQGLRALGNDERRELRIPKKVRLAKLENEGSYMSVTGGFSTEWLALSEGLTGAFHLDSSEIARLPKEEAELTTMKNQIRERAMVLEENELTEIDLFDHWTVSHLPSTVASGVSVIAPPVDIDPADGTPVRRDLRRALKRVNEAPVDIETDLKALVVVTATPHIEKELVTTALKGMSPTNYVQLDLIVVVADGELRQVLKPRKLPWEN